MANIVSYGLTSTYQEDVSVTTGTELIGGPATVWDVTVALESDNTAVVSFSNTTSSYDSDSRCGKVVLDGPGTHHLVFPKGLPVTTGLCVVSNVASVDVRVSYE